MECVLHIGSAKTATSSLQELLFQNRLSLAAKGWLYPETGLWTGDRSHNSLGLYFWNDILQDHRSSSFADFMNRFSAEIRGWENIIVSSELIEKALLHGNGNAQIFLRRLAACGYSVRVVYAVRRQDHYLDSQFKQAVSDAYTPYAASVKDYIATHAPALTYAKTAASWQAMPEVSSVSVIHFREGRVGETIAAVLEAMGQTEMLAEGRSVPMVNPSLDGDYLRLKHYLNRIALPAEFHQRYFGKLAFNLPEEDRSEKLTLFSTETRHQLLQSFLADTAELAATYGIAVEDWNNDRATRAMFQPLGPSDLGPVMDRIRRIDQGLADAITAQAHGKLPLD
jgi:hypothetical protein